MNTIYQLPDGRQVRFMDRERMRRNKPMFAPYRLPVTLPLLPLPIDWTNNGTLSIPMDGNDQYGDCMYAAACHIDNVMTANVGTESTFDLATLEQHYKALSGGDNGLDEDQIVAEWTKGLCGVADATIEDRLDIDPTNAQLCQSALGLFGNVFFMLSVPNRWINSAAAGAAWDAPASPNPMNGHGVLWGGVDTQGRYRLGTWGFWLYLTAAGVKDCDPSGFVVFSKRWFNPTTGMAPNGLHYTQLAQLWQEAGGKALPASTFPSPLPAT